MQSDTESDISKIDEHFSLCNNEKLSLIEAFKYLEKTSSNKLTSKLMDTDDVATNEVSLEVCSNLNIDHDVDHLLVLKDSQQATTTSEFPVHSDPSFTNQNPPNLVSDNTSWETSNSSESSDASVVNHETNSFLSDNINVNNVNEDITSIYQTEEQPEMKYRVVEWTNKLPKLIAFADSNFNSNQCSNNFFRGCLWSPDGSCLLTNSHDNILRLFNLPSSVLEFDDLHTIDSCEKMTFALAMREKELIYDYCWYPFMDSSDPVSCCFASSSRRNPIRLWDAFTGTVRASYRPFNHLGEAVSALSIEFSSDAKLLYAGFSRYMLIFDVGRPGSESIRRPKLGKKSPQGGIISCISVLKDSSRNLYATGSYNGSVCIYSGIGNLISRLMGNPPGVTQVRFNKSFCSNSAPWYILAGGRMDSRIFIWDARNLTNPICIFNRRVENHQRFQFDIDPSGNYLFTGNQTGLVCAYNLADCIEKFSSGSPICPELKWRAHEDSAHGLSVHPSLALLATTSGQRRISLPNSWHDTNNVSSDSDTSLDSLAEVRLTDEDAAQLPLDDNSTSRDSNLKLAHYGRLACLPSENRLNLWGFATNIVNS